MRSLVVVVFSVMCLTGCGLFDKQVAVAPDVDKLSKMPYPGDVPFGEDIDIVVVREGWNIRLVNRTARSYGDMQMWLNEQWVGEVKTVSIGTKNIMPLGAFINEHREPYPVGSLLTPDSSLPVVLAEFYDARADKRHRLNVRVILPDSVVADAIGSK